MSIPSNQVVLVTGTPRSGTSLMMQTLRLLGVRVAGQSFPAEERSEVLTMASKHRRSRRVAHARQLNPRGFYELSGVVSRGLDSLQDLGGHAVKVISSAAFPRLDLTRPQAGLAGFDGQLDQNNQANQPSLHHPSQEPLTKPALYRHPQFGTDPDLVYRYILCLRNPQHVAQSQTQLIAQTEIAEQHQWAFGRWRATPARYLQDNGSLLQWLAEQDNSLLDRFMAVDYDAFLDAPRQTIERVVAHLQWPGVRRAVAIANVDQRLRRSATAPAQCPKDLSEAATLAETVHHALLTLDRQAMQSASAQLTAYQNMLRRQRACWYDESVGLVLNMHTARQLAESPAERATAVRRYIHELRRGMHPATSSDYTEPVGAATYTIARPDPWGDLLRRKVLYRGACLTREAALMRHQQRWVAGLVRVDRNKLSALLYSLEGQTHVHAH